MLPQPPTPIIDGGIKLVFDPTKSPHYKVVNAGLKTDDDVDVDGDGGSYIQIETYSSKTGSLSVCDNRFPLGMFNGFEDIFVYSVYNHIWLAN